MKNFILKTILALAIATTSLLVPSYAQDSSSIQNISNGGISQQFETANIVSEKLENLKLATRNYYIQNGAWPAVLADVITDGFYFGNLNTPYGTLITGGTVGPLYLLNITADTETIAEYIAGKNNGLSAGNIVNVGVTVQSAPDTLMLNLDPVGSGNTMNTDLLMDSNDISNINNLTADTINASTGVYDNGNRVYSASNQPSKADVGLNNISNYGISDDYSGGNSSTYASQKAVTDAYNSLNSLKLDATAQAVDSNLFDGLTSAAYARSSTTINGYALNSNISLTKTDVGLNNVENYSSSNSYVLNSPSTYATSQAVNNLYNFLETNKLNASATSVNSELLDGLNSSDFARSNTTINGNIFLICSGNLTISNSQIGTGLGAAVVIYSKGVADYNSSTVYGLIISKGNSLELDGSTVYGAILNYSSSFSLVGDSDITGSVISYSSVDFQGNDASITRGNIPTFLGLNIGLDPIVVPGSYLEY